MPDATRRKPEHLTGYRIEYVDRYPWIPILFLIVLPFALQLPFWIFVLSSAPMWFYSSVTQSAHFLPK